MQTRTPLAEKEEGGGEVNTPCRPAAAQHAPVVAPHGSQAQPSKGRKELPRFRALVACSGPAEPEGVAWKLNGKPERQPNTWLWLKKWYTSLGTCAFEPHPPGTNQSIQAWLAPMESPQARSMPNSCRQQSLPLPQKMDFHLELS